MKYSSNCYLTSHRSHALLSTVSLFGLLAASAQVAATTTVCVTTAAELQTALTAAQSNGNTNHILVARGYYSLNTGSEYFNSITAQQLDITGGYNSDCSSLIKNPALTVFDSGGLNPVFNIQSSAGVSVRYLTIQNGFSPTVGGGLYIIVSDGGIIVDYNIIRNNSGANQTGLVTLISNSAATGNIHVDGNLIIGNSATGQDSAGYVANEGTGSFYFTNNTVVGNINTNTTAGAVGGFVLSGTVSPTNGHVSNNIAWNNTNFDFRLLNLPVFLNNDYQNLSGATDAGSSGNLSVDPQFASSGNFHLLATSPLLGAGTLTPAGNLPTIDIEGHPRSYNGLVDMGAYERGDEIYADGFDH